MAHHTDRMIFEEDEVSLVEGDVYKCGLVLQGADYLSSDDEEEDEENDLFEKVKAGTVRVAWHPEGTEEVLAESKLRLEDRSLMPGDVIRRLVQGQSSQRGYVLNTRVLCHLHVISTNQVIQNVDSRILELLEPWEMDPGDVYLDSWVGKIDSINEVLHLDLPDHLSIKLNTEDGLDFLEDIEEKRDLASEYFNSIFCEGQLLKTSLRYLRRTIAQDHPHTHWLSKSNNTEIVCMVQKVEVEKMEVQWMCRGYGLKDENNPPSNNSPPPRSLQKSHIERLQMLDCFGPCSIQVGDRAFYTVTEGDTIQSLNPEEEQPLLHCLRKGHQAASSACSGTELEENRRNLENSQLNHGRILTAADTISQGDVPCDASLPNQRASKDRTECENSSLLANCDKAKSCRNKSSLENLPPLSSSIKEKPSKVGDGDSNSLKSKTPNRKESKTPNKKIAKEQNIIDECQNSSESVPSISSAMDDSSTTHSKPPAEDKSDASDSENDEESDMDTDSCDSVTSDAGQTEAKDEKSSQNHNKSSLAKKVFGGYKKKKSKSSSQLYEHPMQDRTPVPGKRICVEVIYTSSFIDVLWQDGTRECAVPSASFYPIQHLDEQEFFPGDYVVNSEADPDMYGVVESVDHFERTCKVHWMNTFQIGHGDKPDSTLMSEEVSVYDIKDHPDYKFRPGHVVVRVGGYKNDSADSQTAAAGQVFELGTDGQIEVQWADRTRSNCYPQDIYLIEYELSELDDSQNDSDEDFDSDETGDSWETEEEEEVEGGDKTGQSDSVLVVEAAQKTDLDQCMDEVLSSLQAVEEDFEKAVSDNQEFQTPHHILEDLLKIYHRSRTLDRSLRTTYFRESNISLVMQAIRSMLDRQRGERMIHKAFDLFEANRKMREKKDTISEEMEVCQESVADKDEQEQRAVEEGETKLESTAEEATQQTDANSGTDIACTAEAMSDSAELPATTKEEYVDEFTDAVDMKMASALYDFIEKDKSAMTYIEKYVSHFKEDLDKTFKVDEESKELWVERIVRSCSNSMLVAVLACLACRCLRQQLLKVQANLNQKWEELKKCGKLKVLEEEEDNDEEGELNVDPKSSSALDIALPVVDTGVNSLKLDSPKEDASAKEKSRLRLDLTSPVADRTLDMLPVTPQTPAEVLAKIDFNREGFTVETDAHEGHRFYQSNQEATDFKAFASAVRKEIKMLRTGLAKGIFVKGFEDRMDLYTVMMLGPSSTPYEDGLFFFDIQLPSDYPTTPPRVHYVSYCCDRLNPNLYEDGKVCVSLLGTWNGKGTEVWTSKSSLLQVLISIQGLILVPEPYYNEAGYEKQRGTQHGLENSRMYNEMALLKMVESMRKICQRPVEIFAEEAKCHIQGHAPRMISRLERWLEIPTSETGSSSTADPGSTKTETPSPHISTPDSDTATTSSEVKPTTSENTPSVSGELSTSEMTPDYPLLPLSKGFCITLKKHIQQYKQVLEKQGLKMES